MGSLTVWLIAGANGVSTLGNTALFTGVIWIVVHGHGDARTAGFMLAVCGGVTVVLSPLVGALLDRRHGIRLVLLADYGAFVVLAALALRGESSASTVLWVAMLTTALGGVAYGPGVQMMIGRTVPDDGRRNANARIHTASRIALIGGPLIGGAVVSVAGQRGLLIFDAATFLISGVIITLVLMRPAASEKMRPKKNVRPVRFIECLRFMIRDRVVRSVLLIGATVNMLTSGFSILLPALAAGNSDSGVSYGILFSTYQAGMLLIAAALSSDRISRLSVGNDSLAVALSLTVFGVGFVVAVLVDDLRLLGASVFLVGAGLSATSLFADTKFLVSVPEEMQGRVFSLANSIFGSLRPAGSAVGGVLVSVSTVLVGVTAAAAAVGCAGFMATRRPLETIQSTQEAQR
ncbi:MFS transporter [Nocardia sp. NPDC058658]|uniref:MFS transporter n=1 Tax=Nocardia sp. NPDC058658 TaxID=3346580 RepID=UPI0036548705